MGCQRYTSCKQCQLNDSRKYISLCNNVYVISKTDFSQVYAHQQSYTVCYTLMLFQKSEIAQNAQFASQLIRLNNSKAVLNFTIIIYIKMKSLNAHTH